MSLHQNKALIIDILAISRSHDEVGILRRSVTQIPRARIIE